MINFKHTAEADGLVLFVNSKHETVKTYTIAELEGFVIDKGLNVTYEMQLASGSGQVTDPNNVEEEVEVERDVKDYIDLHWEEVTEKFYLWKNPVEFKSANTPQITRKTV